MQNKHSQIQQFYCTTIPFYVVPQECCRNGDHHEAKTLRQYIDDGRIINEKGIFLKHCHTDIYKNN
jgi:hypothetical protein